MQICNACRYCEGFCAVFPAMTRRLEFAQGRRPLPRQPVPQLRRLPARLPVRAAARVRGQRAARDGAGARRDLRRVRLAARARRAVPAQRPDAVRSRWRPALRCSWCWRRRATGTLWRRASAGDFYAVFPHNLMVSAVRAGVPVRGRSRWRSACARFWRAAATRDRRRGAGASAEAAHDALRAEVPRRRPRRRLQRGGRPLHALRGGASTTSPSTASCCASPPRASRRSTTTLFGWPAPYPLTSLPEAARHVGGVALLVGTAGLFWLQPAAPSAAQRPGAAADGPRLHRAAVPDQRQRPRADAARATRPRCRCCCACTSAR